MLERKEVYCEELVEPLIDGLPDQSKITSNVINVDVISISLFTLMRDFLDLVTSCQLKRRPKKKNL